MSVTNLYSRIEQILHNLALNSSTLQEILGDIEQSLYSNTWNNIPIKQPIFITSLPRAGTTIVLESLYRFPGLASHTYRNMPFILTPVLWHKISCAFQKGGILRERAHRDGLVISEDSPEAFEEVLWKKYFPNQYSDNGIKLWNTFDQLFFNRFQEHIKKIISLQSSGQIDNSRYISKNNTNIARINVLEILFKDAVILIPFRNPLEHAISLWRQHNNFLTLHAEDNFSRKYMDSIGHFEFGELHRPILFPKYHLLTTGLYPTSIEYWLGYWISAFEYLLMQKNVIFLRYETLCNSKLKALKKLSKYLNINAKENEIKEAVKSAYRN